MACVRGDGLESKSIREEARSGEELIMIGGERSVPRSLLIIIMAVIIS